MDLDFLRALFSLALYPFQYTDTLFVIFPAAVLMISFCLSMISRIMRGKF